METSFARAIEEHLELKRQHETQARVEAGQDHAGAYVEPDPAPAAAKTALVAAPDDEDSLWGRPRDFDWGD
jgi:hypothetical protein